MNDWKNDPRLTAYALGELDSAERAEIEKLVLHDPAARDEVAAIRRTGEMLHAELAGNVGGLSELQKARINSAVSRPRRHLLRPFAAAASILLAIGLPAWVVMVSRPAQETIMARSPRVVPPLPQQSVGNVNTGRASPTPADIAIPDLKKELLSTPSDVSVLLTAKDEQIRDVAAQIYSQSALSKSRGVRTLSSGHRKTIKGAVPSSPAAPTEWLNSDSSADGIRDFGADHEVGRPSSTSTVQFEKSPDDGWRRSNRTTAESYEPVKDNDFARVSEQPLSTFSIDVDTASYSNIRRFITAGQLPPPDAVRIEELINYFNYDYTPPKGDEPFSVTVDVAACPWDKEHRLARIGLKGKVLDEDRPACNLVFLMDVSGSMAPENRLPMLKQAMKMLVRKLRSDDRVAIVTYAGTSGLALPSTSCAEKQPILDAFDRLNADGSTNGGEGIQMAYRVAQENFLRGGVNRVILATDGDFNVGVTDRGQLIQMVQEKAKSGVFLTVLGVGMGNFKDATLEQLADKGNGNYAYLDTMAEARKVLVDQMGGTLVTIAKDVKIQIEFNPAVVGAYRLIGYENRLLAARDFNDDRKDAGDIGAGHTVTALYELVPANKLQGLAGVDPLKYQTPDAAKGPPVAELSAAAKTGEMMTVKLRYKEPDGQTSKLLERPVTDYLSDFTQASEDFRFAAAVAAYGMLLRNSPFAGEATFDLVQDLAGGSIGKDASGYRSEFLEMVGKTKSLSKSGQ